MKMVFTSQSSRNFHQRMLICKYVLEEGHIPINSFNLFGYFLYELVDRDLVIKANNEIVKRCDELWVFGEISEGVRVEIELAKKIGKPVRYFDIKSLPDKIIEVPLERTKMNQGIVV